MCVARIGTLICVHDDHWFLKDSIESFAPAGPVFVFVTKIPWRGPVGDWERSAAVAEKAGATVLVGKWPVEVLHRQGAAQVLMDQGFSHALIPNSDEIIDQTLLESLTRIAKGFVAERVYVDHETYWKRPDYVVRLRDGYQPLLMLELAKVWLDDVYAFSGRLYGGGKGLTVRSDHGVLHHLGYVGPDERIKRKLAASARDGMVMRGWWERVWEGWENDHMLGDLHPSNPPVYAFAERISRPFAMASVPDYRKPRPALREPSPSTWPRVSVIIATTNNPKQMRECLTELTKSRDLLHEVIVVDNASADGAGKVGERYDCATVIRTPERVSLGVARNHGSSAATGEILLFLDSDTILPRPSLICLVEAFGSSGMIAAAGPMTNRLADGQQIAPTYTSPVTVDLFAEDFAGRSSLDRDVDLLDGACLAIRQSAIREVGPFDSALDASPFECLDLCYRLRRHGYRLRLATNSYVHSEMPSHGLNLGPTEAQLLDNRKAYQLKWQHDIESGFISGLPGVSRQICFDRNRLLENGAVVE